MTPANQHERVAVGSEDHGQPARAGGCRWRRPPV